MQYNSGMDEIRGCLYFSTETLWRLSRIYEYAVGAYTPPWSCLCDHDQRHFNHLPCYYNVDEHGTSFLQNNLWRG